MADCLGKCGPFQVRKISFDPKGIEHAADPVPMPKGDALHWPQPKNDDVEAAFKKKIKEIETPRPLKEEKKCAEGCNCRPLPGVFTEDEVEDTIEVEVPVTQDKITYTYKLKCKVGRKDGLADGVCSDPPKVWR